MGNYYYLNKGVICSGSWQENCILLGVPAPTGKNLVPYCLSPLLLENILQRKLSSQAYLSVLPKERHVHVLSSQHFSATLAQMKCLWEL